jgi:protein subunit release factor B
MDKTMFFSTADIKNISGIDRDAVLSLDDRQLLELCRVEAFTGSWPGGQHRNRNYTAVRIIFKAFPEFSAEDSVNRSQKQNIASALQKLRIKMAVLWRKEAPELYNYTHLNTSNILYALELARLLDMVKSCDLDHKEAALRLNLSNSKLLKELYRLPEVWQQFQAARAEFGLMELKPPRN